MSDIVMRTFPFWKVRYYAEFWQCLFLQNHRSFLPPSSAYTLHCAFPWLEYNATPIRAANTIKTFSSSDGDSSSGEAVSFTTEYHPPQPRAGLRTGTAFSSDDDKKVRKRRKKKRKDSSSSSSDSSEDEPVRHHRKKKAKKIVRRESSSEEESSDPDSDTNHNDKTAKTKEGRMGFFFFFKLQLVALSSTLLYPPCCPLYVLSFTTWVGEVFEIAFLML